MPRRRLPARRRRDLRGTFPRCVRVPLGGRRAAIYSPQPPARRQREETKGCAPRHPEPGLVRPAARASCGSRSLRAPAFLPPAPPSAESPPNVTAAAGGGGTQPVWLGALRQAGGTARPRGGDPLLLLQEARPTLGCGREKPPLAIHLPPPRGSPASAAASAARQRREPARTRGAARQAAVPRRAAGLGRAERLRLPQPGGPSTLGKRLSLPAPGAGTGASRSARALSRRSLGRREGRSPLTAARRPEGFTSRSARLSRPPEVARACGAGRLEAGGSLLSCA